MTGFCTRFAPSPTGYLHLGHVASVSYARRTAGEEGKFLIRIEDIDPQRCLPCYEQALREDLDWLGFFSEVPILRQSDHFPVYRAALDRLREMGLVYRCACSRAQVRAEARGMAPDASPIYGGRCRSYAVDTLMPHVWRLDMRKALAQLGGSPSWTERDGREMPGRGSEFGDVVLGRRDNGVSYPLCVTCDDSRQGITLVTRGADLIDQTSVHRILQELLGFPQPLYAHHDLIRDENGQKLSKREGAISLRALRKQGYSSVEIIALAEDALEKGRVIPADKCADK